MNAKECKIAKIEMALQEAIENKRMQMQNKKSQGGVSLAIPHLFSGIFNKAGDSYSRLSGGLEQGGEYVQDFLKKTQLNIRENPWEALRVVAMSSFAVGLFLSRRHKKPSIKDKS